MLVHDEVNDQGITLDSATPALPSVQDEVNDEGMHSDAEGAAIVQMNKERARAGGLHGNCRGKHATVVDIKHEVVDATQGMARQKR
jgi:hypothetical protein